MNTKSREIILINQLNIDQIVSSLNLQINDSEYFMFNPVELFKTIDWTKFEEEPDVINAVYSILFDEFVIARKKIFCYWPNDYQSHKEMQKLNEYCQSARVELSEEERQFYPIESDKMMPEYERLWSSFILFLVESLCEDIKLNEEIEEIATLKHGNESVVIFSIREDEITHYSYITSQVTLFEVESISDVSSREGRTGVNLFPNFQELISSLQDEINIKEFSTNFSNSALEKQYYNAISRNFNSYNLVKQWMANYSLN